MQRLHCKKHCTDSEEGRLLESRPDSWLQSELSRFHRVISLALLLLAVIILVAEIFRYPERNDQMAILFLLVPISIVGPRHFISFLERTAQAKPSSESTFKVY